MEVIIIVFVFVLVFILEFIPIIKAKQKKEIWIYSIALSISFCLLVVKALGFDIPSPFKPIEKGLKHLFRK